MNIKLKVYNENGFVSEGNIDLTNKLQERGITKTQPPTPYSATNISNCESDPQQGKNNQFNMVSGGQLLPEQSINYDNTETDTIQTFKIKPSVNIKIRYDGNEPLSSRWNIEVYVDRDDSQLSWKEKRLITKHPKKIHNVRDSKHIEVKYWIDSVEQESIKSQKPDGC